MMEPGIRVYHENPEFRDPSSGLDGTEIRVLSR
jgi:hypothetical protein